MGITLVFFELKCTLQLTRIFKEQFAFILMNIVQSIDEFHLPKTQSQVIRLQFLNAILYEGSNHYKYPLQGRNFCHVDILDYSTQMLSKLLQNH